MGPRKNVGEKKTSKTSTTLLPYKVNYHAIDYTPEALLDAVYILQNTNVGTPVSLARCIWLNPFLRLRIMFGLQCKVIRFFPPYKQMYGIVFCKKITEKRVNLLEMAIEISLNRLKKWMKTEIFGQVN